MVEGPGWLHTPQSEWPLTPELVDKSVPGEERETPAEISVVSISVDLPILQQISSFSRLRWVTAWILRFVHNGRANKKKASRAECMVDSTECYDG